MEAEALTGIIGNYGFPIMITLWFMFRTETIIKKNTEAIDNLKDVILTNGRNKR